jgi:hypothetical protein
MVVNAVPAIPVEKPIDDMLGVRVLAIDGDDSGELRTSGRYG